VSGPRSTAELEAQLSAPRAETVAALASCPGDVIVLGAGGKMGPTLARMARRAATTATEQDGLARRVFAVSRFSDARAAEALQAAGVEAISADLLDGRAVSALPDAPNVIFMAGQKFGTAASPERTWAINVTVPGLCAARFADSRIVAFSTGNVYPLTPASGRGSSETDTLGPIGMYAESCVAREAVFARTASSGTRVAIVRLNYAIDLRYGVLCDIASAIAVGAPVSLAMGYVNVIWQGDANRAALELLPHAATPPCIVNVTGDARLSVRALAQALGSRLGRAPTFASREAADALLSDTSKMRALLAAPEVSLDEMLDWTAVWVRAGGETLRKPTHFGVRDGQF